MSETHPANANPLEPDTDAQTRRIRQRAYFLWEQDGSPAGQELEYWERARELQAIADSAGSALEPNPMLHPGADRMVDEAELEENLGEFPDRLSDQGEHRSAPMTRAAEHAELREG
jgi:Protein of unknown function (DUF2934)